MGGWEEAGHQEVSCEAVSANNVYINQNGTIAILMGMLMWKGNISQNPTLERTTGS